MFHDALVPFAERRIITMYFRKKEFTDVANALQKQIEEIQHELDKCPGHLVWRKKHQKIYYSERIDSEEHGITHDIEKIHRLTRKKYLQEYAKHLSNNLKIIKYCAAHYTDLIPEEIAAKLALENPGLPVKAMLASRTDAWASAPYQKNPYYKENLEYSTTSGIVVRSKSEREIGNALEAMKIPYRYDAKITCGDMTYYADFVIKRTDGSLVIWEHFGRTHDKIYRAKSEIRIKDYIHAGYRPWDNLVWTLESDIKDSRNIRKIIRKFILPD